MYWKTLKHNFLNIEKEELQLFSYTRYLGVYTHSMETIYLFLSTQVAVGTFFMKSTEVREHVKLNLQSQRMRPLRPPPPKSGLRK